MQNKTRDFARLARTLLPQNRSGQEEIVGFIVIVVIVAVILLILLSFLIQSPERGAAESYEVESFLYGALQYTTECDDYIEFLSLNELIIACENQETCVSGQNSCELMNSTIKDLIRESWGVGEQSVIKGYEFKILIEGEERFFFEEGNKTANYRGNFQDFARSGRDYQVIFNVYE